MNKRFDILAGGAFLAIGAFFVTASRGITKSSYGSNVGPAVFPTILGSLLILLSLMVIYKALASGKATKGGSVRDYGRLAVLVLATVVYILLFKPLGYMISTFLYLSFVFQFMERKRLLSSLLVSAGFSVAVYAAYVGLFQGNLPPFPEFLTALFARS